jgi:DNA ligase D-like protein (predicted polymerase)
MAANRKPGIVANRKAATLLAGGREVPISNPDKVLFPQRGHTKLDLARYYMSVADGALRGAGGRPNMLVRYPDGVQAEHFYQKRAPKSRPPWIEVAELHFPSGRVAQEIVPRDAAALAWLANLACLELHPHPVRAEDLDHPDELRVDLDPVPGVKWHQVREVTAVTRGVLDDYHLTGWPKTSGSRGMHMCAHRAPLGFRCGAPGRTRAGAGSREARAETGHQQVVEGGAPRRIRRLQPECEGPHRRLSVLGAANARCPGVGATFLG